mmetsp:Transcript_13258/g.20740  ORF Transcript_13258/g.20740 Transcript_13258/m.20740 type:complete len:246 (+) Transcript_13258:3935-4672(+)
MDGPEHELTLIGGPPRKLRSLGRDVAEPSSYVAGVVAEDSSRLSLLAPRARRKVRLGHGSVPRSLFRLDFLERFPRLVVVESREVVIWLPSKGRRLPLKTLSGGRLVQRGQEAYLPHFREGSIVADRALAHHRKLALGLLVGSFSSRRLLQISLELATLLNCLLLRLRPGELLVRLALPQVRRSSLVEDTLLVLLTCHVLHAFVHELHVAVELALGLNLMHLRRLGIQILSGFVTLELYFLSSHR